MRILCVMHRMGGSRLQRVVSDSGAMRYIGLVRVYLSLSARAAVPLGTPIFFGVFVVAFIVFGPTGMRAADLVFTMRTSPPLTIGLWLGWIVLLFPVARLALIPPSSMYLRWLPAPRTILYASAAFCVFVVELPWMILWARGEGIISAFATGFGALALHAAWATRPLGIVHGLFLLGWAISIFLPYPGLSLLVAGVTSIFAVKRAIDRAPEMHAIARGSSRARAPAIALALSHMTYVLRKEPAVLGRMLILSSLAGIIMPLAARGHDLETPPSFGALSLALAAISLSPAMAGVSGGVLRSERLSGWLCDVLSISARTRITAAALASASIGGLGGIFLGVMAVSLLHHPAWPVIARVIAIPAFFGAATGCILTGFAREAEASPQRGDRGMISALVVMVVGIVAASWWGERAIGVFGIVVMVSLTVMPKRLELLRRRRGIS